MRWSAIERRARELGTQPIGWPPINGAKPGPDWTRCVELARRFAGAHFMTFAFRDEADTLRWDNCWAERDPRTELLTGRVCAYDINGDIYAIAGSAS